VGEHVCVRALRLTSEPCPSTTSGARAAAINATTLALINAGIPMKEFVTACSAGFVDSTPIIGISSPLRLVLLSVPLLPPPALPHRFTPSPHTQTSTIRSDLPVVRR
jgi:hypothetical protein